MTEPEPPARSLVGSYVDSDRAIRNTTFNGMFFMESKPEGELYVTPGSTIHGMWGPLKCNGNFQACANTRTPSTDRLDMRHPRRWHMGTHGYPVTDPPPSHIQATSYRISDWSWSHQQKDWPCLSSKKIRKSNKGRPFLSMHTHTQRTTTTPPTSTSTKHSNWN